MKKPYTSVTDMARWRAGGDLIHRRARMFSVENEAWQNESRKPRKEQIWNIHCVLFLLPNPVLKKQVTNKVVQFYFIASHPMEMYHFKDAGQSSQFNSWGDKYNLPYYLLSSWEANYTIIKDLNQNNIWINKFLDNQRETIPSPYSQVLCNLLINCKEIHSWIISQKQKALTWSFLKPELKQEKLVIVWGRGSLTVTFVPLVPGKRNKYSPQAFVFFHKDNHVGQQKVHPQGSKEQ